MLLELQSALHAATPGVLCIEAVALRVRNAEPCSVAHPEVLDLRIELAEDPTSDEVIDDVLTFAERLRCVIRSTVDEVPIIRPLGRILAILVTQPLTRFHYSSMRTVALPSTCSSTVISIETVSILPKYRSDSPHCSQLMRISSPFCCFG